MKNFYYEYLQTLDKNQLIERIYKPFTKRKDLKFKSTRLIALKISYDGANYSGLAEYKYGNTVGNHIRNALEQSSLGSKIVYAGRTDAGVSGISMVASCEVKSRLESPNQSYSIQDNDYLEFNYDMILNYYLPEDIRITGWAPVPVDFSARFTCTQRSYRYYFDPEGLDLDRMREMASKILEMKNFYNLSKHSDKNARYDRTVDHCEIVEDDLLCYLDIRARSFLHNMVRKIFWVLERAGKGEAVDFNGVGIAPPQNLVFCEAKYPTSLNFIYNNKNKEIYKAQYIKSCIKFKMDDLRYKQM
ncbi:tRNA pseudouridine(38/39) synthase [Nosema granulosis]|uniref:tRNA pseudouridine synthase n=1 Tax=Nosema granulosis TaxID=83296 RepID=A0A9P6H1E6_9MICR|nr:tRNA pseudouridine(38/39) synthase [Nosema granulosis]